ncbi:RAB6A [Mytilus coruscus]|uniref:RAB6A n=1 Tax=Mytilus coruscus TaxID=42192 RepID=A0A6J8ESX3_MYTCO|nr:RAB6A [Mytilus coruscus]
MSERINVMFIGDTAVGKTSLIDYFKSGKHDPRIYSSTIVLPETINLDSSLLKIQVVDTPGQKIYEPTVIALYPTCTVFVFIYDKTDRPSLDKINYLYDIVNDHVHSEACEFFLVGNKIDEREKEVVSRQEGLNKKKQLNMKFFIETSAKTGVNIDSLFKEIAETVRKKQKDKGDTVWLEDHQPENNTNAKNSKCPC